MQYNLYYRQNGNCVLHNQYGAAALYVPVVGTIVEIGGVRTKVTSVVYMPEYYRFDIELVYTR